MDHMLQQKSDRIAVCRGKFESTCWSTVPPRAPIKVFSDISTASPRRETNLAGDLRNRPDRARIASRYKIAHGLFCIAHGFIAYCTWVYCVLYMDLDGFIPWLTHEVPFEKTFTCGRPILPDGTIHIQLTISIAGYPTPQTVTAAGVIVAGGKELHWVIENDSLTNETSIVYTGTAWRQ